MISVRNFLFRSASINQLTEALNEFLLLTIPGKAVVPAVLVDRDLHVVLICLDGDCSAVVDSIDNVVERFGLDRIF